MSELSSKQGSAAQEAEQARQRVRALEDEKRELQDRVNRLQKDDKTKV